MSFTSYIFTRLMAIRRVGIMLCFALSLLITVSGDVSAAVPASTCTTDPGYVVPANMQIITTIVGHISCILYGGPGCAASGSISQNMFMQIATESTFITIVRATLSLFVIIYGISFMLGIVQFTYMEFLVRILKFGIVLVFLSPYAWSYFYYTVGVFFHNGTNFFIGLSTQYALGTMVGVDPNQPFQVIDYSIATAFSAKMFMTLLAMFYTPPYGLIFGFLVVMGLMSFVGAILKAAWVYLMSLVVRAFLFGLAPIFIPFILFSKTRHLFDGWLNQLVNTMLQPVLMFTFFAFFSVLIQAAMNNLLRVPVCYLPGSDLWSGLPSDTVTPHFKIWMNGAWQDYARSWGPSGPDEFPNMGLPVFPIDIMDVLIFLILAQLAWRFNEIALNIARELSGTSTSFNMPGAFSHVFNPTRKAASQMLSRSDAAGAAITNRQRAIERNNPGGGGASTAGDPRADTPAAANPRSSADKVTDNLRNMGSGRNNPTV